MKFARLLWDIIGTAILTFLSFNVLKSLSAGHPQITAVEGYLNIYLAFIHLLLLDNVFTVFFGHRSEHDNLLREMEKRLTIPILAKQAIDPKARNAFTLFEKIGALEEMKWFALKFIAFRSMRCFPNGTRAEIPLSKPEYSQLLSKLLKECSSSIEWVGIDSPAELERTHVKEHSEALYRSEVATKKRLFILQTRKYEELRIPENKEIMREFLNRNRASGIDLFFAKVDDVKKAFPSFVLDDYGIYDRCIVIQWTGGKWRKLGKLIIGDEIGEFRNSIDLAMNDVSNIFHQLDHDTVTDSIVVKTRAC